ncbi:HAAS signaling domain-containing protein [Schumannella luteola]
MTQPEPQVVRTYLAELHAALVGMPPELSAEIVAGVREELVGLDAEAAAVRIGELGDPAFIAAEARAEATTNAAARSEASPARIAPYDIVAALVLAVGGIVVPFAGWIVGVGLVWGSRTWSVGEKVWGSIFPVVSGALVALVLSLVAIGEGYKGTSLEVLGLPILAAGVSHFTVLIVIVLTPMLSGVWLLLRARSAVRPQS